MSQYPVKTRNFVVRGFMHKIIFNTASEKQPCSVLWIGDKFSPCSILPRISTKRFASLNNLNIQNSIKFIRTNLEWRFRLKKTTSSAKHN